MRFLPSCCRRPTQQALVDSGLQISGPAWRQIGYLRCGIRVRGSWSYFGVDAEGSLGMGPIGRARDAVEDDGQQDDDKTGLESRAHLHSIQSPDDGYSKTARTD